MELLAGYAGHPRPPPDKRDGQHTCLGAVRALDLSNPHHQVPIHQSGIRLTAAAAAKARLGRWPVFGGRHDDP